MILPIIFSLWLFNQFILTLTIPSQYEQLLLSNIFFISLPSFFVSYLAAKCVRLTSSTSILLFGTGSLITGFGSLIAPNLLILTNELNALITIHNISIFLSSLCLLGSIVVILVKLPTQFQSSPQRIIYGSYLGATAIIFAIAAAYLNGLLPQFFIPLHGPTAIRAFILNSGITLYFLSGLFLAIIFFRHKRIFFLYYAISYLLIASGLLLISLAAGIGSQTNFIGLTLQYSGYIYTMLTIVITARLFLRQPLSLEDAIIVFFLNAPENYKVLLEASKSAIITADSNDQIILCNSSAEKLFKYPPNYALGKKISQILVFDTLTMHRAFTDNDNVRHEEFTATIRTAENRIIPVDISKAIRYTTSQHHNTTYILHDITQTDFYERAMTRFSGLEIAEKMATSLAHEVRNPLTTVHGMLQLMSHKDDNNKARYDLMLSELDRANSLLSEYLALAKTSPSTFEPHNLALLVKDMFPLWQAFASNQGKLLQIDADPKAIPDTLINKQQIKQLLANLIQNALEASPDNGKITVGVHPADGKVTLKVSDNGLGISSEVLNKLGTAFITTKPNGNGLGLAVCYSIAAKHNAPIRVDSTCKGTVFYIDFPMLPPKTLS